MPSLVLHVHCSCWCCYVFLENILAQIMYRILGFLKWRGGGRRMMSMTSRCIRGIHNTDHENAQEITVLFLQYQCMYPPPLSLFTGIWAGAGRDIFKRGEGWKKRGLRWEIRFIPVINVYIHKKIKYFNKLYTCNSFFLSFLHPYHNTPSGSAYVQEYYSRTLNLIINYHRLHIAIL